MINWLDIFIGGVLALSILGAFRNGLVREMARLVALVVGIVGALWFCSDLAVQLLPYIKNEQVAAFASFLLILVGSLLAAGPVAWGFGKFLGWTGMTGVDRILGAAFGLLRGMLISTAVVLAVITFTPTVGSTATVAESQLAPWVMNGARAAAKVAPRELQLAFSHGFEQVRKLWIENVSDTDNVLAQ